MQRGFRRFALMILVALGLLPEVSAGGAATAQFLVSLTIEPDCSVSSAPIAFPVSHTLASSVSQTATLRVQCSNNTMYKVALNAGDVPGSTVANRLLSSGTTTVGYQLYSDAAHTRVWGDSPAAGEISGTGGRDARMLTIYGVVPAQPTPAPGTYTATVTASVTF